MMPLFWTALAFVTGILLGRYAACPLWVWGSASFLMLLAAIIGRKYYERLPFLQRSLKTLRVSPVVLLLIVALGGLRYTLNQPVWGIKDLAWYNERGKFTFTAVVDRTPDRREDAVYLHVAARELYDPTSMTFVRIKGAALMRLNADAQWQLGDLIRFTAAPQTPSENEDFSYRDYLERQGIYTIIYYPTSVHLIAQGQTNPFQLALEKVRQRASQTIFDLFPQPESGLLAGILLGNDNDLPQALTQAYRDTGTAHIIAISGFNMAILAGFFTFLFSRALNRYWAAALSGLALMVYAIFVGASPSVMRAALMAVLAFGGHLIGRKNGGLNALGLTAGLMCLVNPLLLWDASFQLSFMATLGLVLFANPLETWLDALLQKRFPEETAHRLTGPVSEYFLFTLAAQVTTLPVIALQFKRLSLTSLAANPLVLPVQPAVLIMGGVSTLCGMALPAVGKVLAAITWPLLAYSNRMVEALAKYKWGTLTLTTQTALWLSLALIVIILLILFRNYFKKLFKKIGWFYLVLFLLTATALVWSIALRQPDGKVHLSLIRAEEGSSLLLRAPHGQTLLVDPGGSPNQLASAASQYLSPWNFHLDAALLTNRSAAKSLSDLNDRLPVRMAILSPPVYLVSDETSPLSLPDGMQIKKLSDGEIIQIEEGLTIQPITADLEHTALLLTYGETRILIPGGVDPALLDQSANRLSGLSVLILNDQDVANLPTDMWQNFGAQVILWNSPSVAPDPNWLGLDSQSVITLSGDGENYWLEKE